MQTNTFPPFWWCSRFISSDALCSSDVLFSSTLCFHRHEPDQQGSQSSSKTSKDSLFEPGDMGSVWVGQYKYTETNLMSFYFAVLQREKVGMEKNRSQTFTSAGLIFQWGYTCINKYAFVYEVEFLVPLMIEHILFCLSEFFFFFFFPCSSLLEAPVLLSGEIMKPLFLPLRT